MKEMNPPGQLITEALDTVTRLGKIYIYIYIYIERERERERERKREEGDEPPWSINHRGLAYCYTLYIYIERERGRR